MELKNQRKQIIYKMIKSEIVSIKEDGSIFLNQRFFKYTYGLKMINENLKVYLVNTRKEEKI